MAVLPFFIHIASPFPVPLPPLDLVILCLHAPPIFPPFPVEQEVNNGQQLLTELLCRTPQHPVKRGDGIVFDAGRPMEKEEGGAIMGVLAGLPAPDPSMEQPWPIH